MTDDALPTLSQIGKTVFTVLAIDMLFNMGADAIKARQVTQMMNNDFIDKKLADRLTSEFNAFFKLNARVEYHDVSPSHFELENGDSVLAGRSAKHKETIDSIPSRLHELGHVAERGSLSHKLYHKLPKYLKYPRMAAAMHGGAIVSATLTALGHAPKLINEWRASRTANDFARRVLPPREADLVARNLKYAFRTYATQALSETMGTGLSTYAADRLMKTGGQTGSRFMRLFKAWRRARRANRNTSLISSAVKDAWSKRYEYEIPDIQSAKRKRDRKRRAAREESEKRRQRSSERSR